jgi:hypothetical protein
MEGEAVTMIVAVGSATAKDEDLFPISRILKELKQSRLHSQLFLVD